MQSSLKKTLYLSLAAVSLGAVSLVSTTSASAKSYAKAYAYHTLKTDATKRNVEATGTNALYTKPGTVKGAKIVASKATMGKLATSKKSGDYLRAYGVKTTNRNSVYYRVVTMNGKYRSYIYGGKTTDAFAGGIKSAETMTKADMPKETTVYFANPGKKNVTWDAPYLTQYKSEKQVANTMPFAGDKLVITDAAKKTREGSLYYYVKDTNHPSVSGWIYSEAVTTDANVAFNRATDVKVNFTNNGKTVATGVLKDLLADGSTTAKAKAVGTSVGTNATGKVIKTDAAGKANDITDWTKGVLKGSGYIYEFSNANASALLAAKTGDTISLSVKAGNQVTTPLYFYKSSGSVIEKASQLTVFKDKTSTPANANTIALPKLTTGFKGVDGANYTSTDLDAFAQSNKLVTLYTPTYQVNGKNAYTKYTLVSVQSGSYGVGNQAQLVYIAKEYTDATSPVGDGTANSTETDTGHVVGDNPAVHGNSTAGGSTSGNSNAGGSTSGNSTAGGSASGNDNAGGSTSGNDNAGGSTSGNNNAGGSTSADKA